MARQTDLAQRLGLYIKVRYRCLKTQVMDPISAFGLAAAIIQIVDLTPKIVKQLKDYSSEASEVPKSLQHISIQLPLLVNTLDRLKTDTQVERFNIDTRCILKGAIETRLLNGQSPRPFSREEIKRSGNQLIATAAPSSIPFVELQITTQHPWLPYSELPRWPESEQYSRVQRSLRLRSRRNLKPIRTCHILILLGFCTVVGSLIPALWRSVARNDIQGGFSLAQYILGVGVFIIGCMVAIHSRTCTCWQ